MADKQILVPMLVLVALTFIAFVRLAMMRAKAAKVVDPAYYLTYRDGREPDEAHIAARHWGNLFELPVVFYAGCLTAFVLHAVSTGVLVCAWAFVAARLVQSAVHLTANAVMARGMSFILGALFLFGMWAQLAMAILA